MAGRGRGSFNVKGSGFPPPPPSRFGGGRGFQPGYPPAHYGKGYKGGKPSHPVKGAGPHVKPSVQAPPPAPPLPYSKVVRSSAEHFARFPHRAPNEDLTSVTAHWAARETASVLDADPVALKYDPEGIVPPPAESEVPEDKAINARVLICGGVKEGAGNVLNRVDVLARRIGGGRGHIQAYGGLVKREAKDEKVAQSLAALVKAQNGVALDAKQMRKLVEFRYDGQPPTVFFLPDISSAGEEGLLAKAAGTETTEEIDVEEEYESEEGEGEEKKTVKKKRTVKKEKKTRNEEQRPVVVPLLRLLGKPDNADAGQAELHAAADALDEWLRRDGALRLCGVLKKKHEEQAVIKKARAEQQEANQAIKRKHEDEIQVVKRARTDEVQKLDELYADESEGLTDGEKKVALAAHREKLRELEGEERNKVQELRKKFLEEERERKAAAAAKAAEEAKTKVKTKKVRVRDAAAAALFQVFDRSQTNQIHREHLAACLLAADDTGSVATYRELASVTSARDYAGNLNYEELCTVVEEREIPEEPKPEEGEKADGDKPEKMEVDGEVGES
eukprot:Hpha_TRINITY_DN16312_c1_g18::TRINITY_DN16312_c1_g18_i1::g.59694::m.59694